MERILTDRLIRDPELQGRLAIDPVQVAEIREALLEEETHESEPVEVVQDELGRLWLWDGFHRHQAYRDANRQYIPVHIRHGTRSQARLHAAGANQRPVIPRTAAEKRRQVRMVLEDPDGQAWPERAIAKWCGVSRDLVQAVMNELAASSQQPAEEAGSRPPAAVGSAEESGSLLPAADSFPATHRRDQVRKPVPPRLLEVFDQGRAWFLGAIRQLGSFSKDVESRLSSLAARELNCQAVQIAIRDIQAQIAFAEPYAIHQACQGEGCSVCRKFGWFTKGEYQQLPEKDQ